MRYLSYGRVIKCMKSNWFKLSGIFALIATLFVNPITRNIILFILPLGSGFDDLVEIVVIFIAIVVFLIGLFDKKGDSK